MPGTLPAGSTQTSAAPADEGAVHAKPPALVTDPNTKSASGVSVNVTASVVGSPDTASVSSYDRPAPGLTGPVTETALSTRICGANAPAAAAEPNRPAMTRHTSA